MNNREIYGVSCIQMDCLEGSLGVQCRLDGMPVDMDPAMAESFGRLILDQVEQVRRVQARKEMAAALAASTAAQAKTKQENARHQ